MRTRRFLPLAFLVPAGAGAVLAVACTVDVDKYKMQDPPLAADASVDFADLRFEAIAQLPHANEFFELRLIDGQAHVTAKAVFNKVLPTNLTFSLFMKGFIPKANPPYRLDFWYDHDQLKDGGHDGIYDSPPSKTGDHSWRRVLTDPLPTGMTYHVPAYTVYFPHDQNWVDLQKDPVTNAQVVPDFNATTLGSFNLKVTGGTQYIGKMFELRVSRPDTGQLIGLYRKGALEDAQTMTITDILDESTGYQITAFVDVNNDQIYEAGEPSYKIDFTSPAADDYQGTLDLAGNAQVAIDNGNGALSPLDDAGVPITP